MKVKIVSFFFLAKEMCERKIVTEIWKWMCVYGLIHFSFSSTDGHRSEIEQLRKRLSKPLGSSIQAVVSGDRDYCSEFHRILPSKNSSWIDWGVKLPKSEGIHDWTGYDCLSLFSFSAYKKSSFFPFLFLFQTPTLDTENEP